MERPRILWQTWIVVCDGAKALVLRNEGDAELLNLARVEHFTQPQPPTRELGSDRPGRVYQAHGSARSATEERDRHTEGEVAFLSKVADELDNLVRQHAVKRVVLVAPPKALGVLRGQLSPAVRAVMAGEVAKDLAHLTIREIEEHLAP